MDTLITFVALLGSYMADQIVEVNTLTPFTADCVGCDHEYGPWVGIADDTLDDDDLEEWARVEAGQTTLAVLTLLVTILAVVGVVGGLLHGLTSAGVM